MVPVALATQTGGSTIRPAAFCGVFGYKPAFDRFPTAGLKALAPSLDTIGLIARSLDRIARISGVLAGEPAPAIAAQAPRFALCRTPYAAEAEPQTRERLASVARRLADAGADVRELELPAAFAELNELHRVIMANETARSMAHEWRTARKRLSADLAGFIERGLATADDAVAAARTRVAACKQALPALLEDGELILTFPASGEAPVGLASTGNAVFCRLWTLLGVPCLAIPAGRGARGLPLGVQLVGGSAGDPAGDPPLNPPLNARVSSSRPGRGRRTGSPTSNLEDTHDPDDGRDDPPARRLRARLPLRGPARLDGARSESAAP